MITLKEAVKNTMAQFSYACAGVSYYKVSVNTENGIEEYQFPIDMNNREDVGTTAFIAEYKGITLMRYIRKAMGNDTFIKVK
jgi:phage tail tube protein FII